MCEALGYRVTKLKRIRIMNIWLGDLKPGTYREVTEKEKEILYRQLQTSSNMPVFMRKERAKEH